ncbi:MAG: tetratricopeptide repeat protein [Planctomycetota bacterium]
MTHPTAMRRNRTTSALVLLLAAFALAACANQDDAVDTSQSGAQTTQATAQPTPADEPGLGASAGVVTPPPQAAPEQSAVARAESFRSAGDLDRALIEFERAIAINPELTTAYVGAGQIYRERGDLPAAESLFRELTQRAPAEVDGHYNLGLTLQLMRRLTEAVRSYLRALSINPAHFESNLNLATVYLDLSEPAQAAPYAARAVQLRPASAEARANLAGASAALGDHERAVIEYQQAAELAPLTSELLLGLADSLGRLGRHGEMLGTLQEAARLEETAPVFERMGSARFHLRQYEASLASFQRAIELDPTYYPALNGIAVNQLNRFLWSGQRDTAAIQAATGALRRSLQLRPDQPRILQLLDRYGGR